MTQKITDDYNAFLELDREDVDEAFRRAVKQYIVSRRRQAAKFTRKHFGLRGALRLHRLAFGADLIRAPVNLMLALPHIVKLLITSVLQKLEKDSAADRLLKIPTQLETRVAQEVEWLIWTEFLELPYSVNGRKSNRDALGELLVSQPEITKALNAANDLAQLRGHYDWSSIKLEELLSSYTGTRVAAAEIVTALSSVGVGGLIFQQLTPTAFTLGPALAALVAHQAAIFTFPLGTAVGGLWYGLFTVDPSWGLIAGVTMGLLLISSIGAAFAGVVADPVQRSLGIHYRRLNKLVDSLEADLLRGEDLGFKVRAHYVARIFDVFEAIRLTLRSSI
ncbi:MAG: hypothetical protein CFH41_00672 [Alphaproteobacteria bacterium MarineAlpha11_Bin1]|nr:MAG: hypothetical protein CFH41_00672 [Alphaproteobacteria bacterium MarineAlpha11_Bin1]|tara:strand:- start:12038 stop:13042 length:1005 start_codon:yes stop_codon:yes gene_type:complete